MAATTMADGGRTTVRSLLEHFRDDPKLQPLFEQLDELSKRVEVRVLACSLCLRGVRSSPHR